jgi:hypothetical protein
MPACLVEDHDRVLVGGERLGEGVEEEIHRHRGNLGQNEREGLIGRGPHDGEDVGKGEALVAEARRALAFGPPTMRNAALLAEPRLVLEPERETLVGVRADDRVYRRFEPPFLNAACAAGSCRGWRGRAFWREKPIRRTTRDMLAG